MQKQIIFWWSLLVFSCECPAVDISKPSSTLQGSLIERHMPDGRVMRFNSDHYAIVKRHGQHTRTKTKTEIKTVTKYQKVYFNKKPKFEWYLLGGIGQNGTKPLIVEPDSITVGPNQVLVGSFGMTYWWTEHWTIKAQIQTNKTIMGGFGYTKY